MKIYLDVLLLIIVTSLLSLVELPALLKKKNFKELLVVISLFSIGFILNFLLITGRELPNPDAIIVSIIQGLLK